MFLKPFVLILGNVPGQVPSRPPAVSSSSCRMSLQATEGPRAACGRISRLYSLFSPPLGPSHSGELCPSSRMLPWAWELCPESAKTRDDAFREQYCELFTGAFRVPTLYHHVRQPGRGALVPGLSLAHIFRH